VKLRLQFSFASQLAARIVARANKIFKAHLLCLHTRITPPTQEKSHLFAKGCNSIIIFSGVRNIKYVLAGELLFHQSGPRMY